MCSRRSAKCCVLMFILTACTSDTSSTPLLGKPTSSPSVIPAITGTEPPTEAVPLPTIPSAPTPTADPNVQFILPLEAETAISIQSIEMLDETSGWSVGGLVGEDAHILMTHDGGSSWRDITPAAVPIGETLPKVAVGDFIQPDKGWVRYLDSLNVWRTVDGGTTWETTLLFEEEGPMFHEPYPIQFVDDQFGWVLYYAGSGMSHDFSYLFSTSDGGLTWEVLITPGDEDTLLQTCCKTGMLFYDSKLGILTFEQGPFEFPYADWTEDGGATWDSWIFQPYGEDTDQARSHYCETHSPHIFSPTDLVLGISCRENSDYETQVGFLAVSADRGSTWRYVPAPAGDLFFIDSQNGWVLGQDLYSTSDGGAIWNVLSHPDWQGQLQFTDLLHGWVVEEGGALFRTDDGGLTWEGLDPRIANSD